MSNVEIGYRVRKVDGIMVEEFFFNSDEMKICLAGELSKIRKFFARRCQMCVVRNAEAIVDKEEGLHKLRCRVDYSVEAARECFDRYPTGDDVVLSDNWFDVDPEVEDIFKKLVKEEIKIRLIDGKDLGMVASDNIVSILGDKDKMSKFYRDNCDGCRARMIVKVNDNTLRKESYFVCTPVPGRARGCR